VPRHTSQRLHPDRAANSGLRVLCHQRRQLDGNTSTTTLRRPDRRHKFTDSTGNAVSADDTALRRYESLVPGNMPAAHWVRNHHDGGRRGRRFDIWSAGPYFVPETSRPATPQTAATAVICRRHQRTSFVNSTGTNFDTFHFQKGPITWHQVYRHQPETASRPTIRLCMA